MRRPRVFISYAREDKRQVTSLVEILRDGSYDPFFDDGIVAGQNWKHQLLNEIERCHAFIFVMTSASLRSEWCEWELQEALRREKLIIPLKFEANLTVPTELAERHWVDFTETVNNRAIAKLLGGLNTLIPVDDITETSQALKEVSGTGKVSEETSNLSKPISIFVPEIQRTKLHPEAFELTKLDTEYLIPEQLRPCWISDLEFSSDGKSLIGGLSHDRVAVWDAASGRLNHTAQPKASLERAGNWPTRSVAISPNGEFLASTTHQRAVQIWQLNGIRPHKLVETFNHIPMVVAFSANSEWLIAGLDRDGYIQAWSVRDGFRSVDKMKAHTETVTSLKFHPSKMAFVSGSNDGHIKSWEILEEEIREVYSYAVDDSQSIIDIVFSSDSKLIAAGTNTGYINLFEAETGKLVRAWKHEAVIRKLAFSPDGKLLASASNDRTLKVWHVANGRKLIGKKFDSAVTIVVFSPSGEYLVTGTEKSRKALLWHVERKT